MNAAAFAADLPVRAAARIGGSLCPLRVPSEWRAQEKPPISEPDHDIGPGSGEDQGDDEDDDDEDEDDEGDEDAAGVSSR